MMSEPRITFRDMPPSDFIRSYVEKTREKLERLNPKITACKVALEAPHRHHLHGNHFRVRIDIAVPGDEIVVDRDAPERHEGEDLYAAIDDAFDRARRLLVEHARRHRA